MMLAMMLDMRNRAFTAKVSATSISLLQLDDRKCQGPISASAETMTSLLTCTMS